MDSPLLLPPKEAVDGAWTSLASDGPLGAVLVIVLALLVGIIIYLLRMLTKKDNQIIAQNEKYFKLGMSYSLNLAKNNERSKRIVEMLSYLIGKKTGAPDAPAVTPAEPDADAD